MKAKHLKNAILQMAVQGTLVPQDPSDEPASVLLERIREKRAELIKKKKIKAPKGGESVIYRAEDGSYYEKRATPGGVSPSPSASMTRFPSRSQRPGSGHDLEK